eukprot:5764649-Karenia_brevis.AAC.1
MNRHPEYLLAKRWLHRVCASDKATWADATEEEQKKMEENLRLPEEIPQPFLEKFPALSGARRSS